MDPLLPAAQYLRVSNAEQAYSLQNQAKAIERYATAHGFKVIASYTDVGRSGLLLKRRPGLIQLLRDVTKSKAEFKAILVYDVSRWGRFQDTDEGAHYEFLCKAYGLPVHYCAEMFMNDGSFPSSLMKSMRRAMAGEFSRELSAKTYRGKAKVAALGYRVGSSAPYGLRRVLVRNDGTRLALARGERKSLATDRVMLAPGEPEEIACVQLIFSLASQGKQPAEIAADLRKSGRTKRGKQWNRNTVRAVLQDVQYTGCSVWGRYSGKLLTPLTPVPADRWIAKPNAFEPIVDQDTFDTVQRNIKVETRHYSDEELLEHFRHVHGQHGKISRKIIDGVPGGPSYEALKWRFGSMGRLYELLNLELPEERRRRWNRIAEARNKRWKNRSELRSQLASS